MLMLLYLFIIPPKYWARFIILIILTIILL